MSAVEAPEFPPLSAKQMRCIKRAVRLMVDNGEVPAVFRQRLKDSRFEVTEPLRYMVERSDVIRGGGCVAMAGHKGVGKSFSAHFTDHYNRSLEIDGHFENEWRQRQEFFDLAPSVVAAGRPDEDWVPVEEPERMLDGETVPRRIGAADPNYIRRLEQARYDLATRAVAPKASDVEDALVARSELRDLYRPVRARYKFIGAQQLMNLVTKDFDKYREFIEYWRLLIIDDLGRDYVGEKAYYVAQWEELLDFRWHNLYPTILTTNLEKPVFMGRYGERFEDRLNEWGYWRSWDEEKSLRDKNRKVLRA